MNPDASAKPEPALTPEQWEAALQGEPWGPNPGERHGPALESMLSAAGDGVGPFEVPNVAAMALANAALPDGSGHKITRALAVLLRDAAERYAADDWGRYASEAADAERWAALIEALLPPPLQPTTPSP